MNEHCADSPTRLLLLLLLLLLFLRIAAPTDPSVGADRNEIFFEIPTVHLKYLLTILCVDVSNICLWPICYTFHKGRL